ncbi:MAG: GHMP kinase [Flavobacteriaceae bacterium]|nr:GHMP kinase [Flavobacteriaceae bacterium]|tara:strand:+ start:12310 stop:13371 length:1062 start_codon:yes stop_codon:yes gene_type:complete
MFELSIPGRICFYGDHQDYLGLPVIAGTINRYIYLKALPISSAHFQINLKDYNESFIVNFQEEPSMIRPGDYFRAGLCVLKKEGIIPNKGFCVDISGDLPSNSGLSSSSALVVSWIKFLVSVYAPRLNASDIQIAKWAFSTEVEFFNQSGGIMDQFTISLRGLIYINTNNKSYKRLNGDFGSLLIIESGIPKDTQELLKQAKEKSQKAIDLIKNNNKKFEILKSDKNHYELYKNYLPKDLQPYWKAAIHNFVITKKAKQILNKKKTSKILLGNLMNAHQKILQNEIKNTPSKIIKQLEAGNKAGTFGSKIVGSGGGGCMVAMLDKKNIFAVKKAFIDSGAKAVHEVELIYPKN